MKQNEYTKILEEMMIPALKISHWSDIVVRDYSDQFHEEPYLGFLERDLFDEILGSSRKLIGLLLELQTNRNTHNLNQLETFTHGVNGPIMYIRNFSKLILANPAWKLDIKQSESKRQCMRHIEKIYSAADYLSSLNSDAASK